MYWNPEITGVELLKQLKSDLISAFEHPETQAQSKAGLSKEIRAIDIEIAKATASAQPAVEDDLDAARRRREERRAGSDDPASTSRRGQQRRSGRSS